MKQARQLVVLGQICIGNQKITIPSYPVSRDEEEEIQYHPRSNLNDENHSIRQTIAGVRESASFEEVERPEFLLPDGQSQCVWPRLSPCREDHRANGIAHDGRGAR